MTREEVKELLPIIQAFAEGKAIQFRCKTGEWLNIIDEFYFTLSPDDYRIKPEPKYRPFQTQEECWDEMHKHPDFGWLVNKNSKSIYHINVICCDDLCLDETSLNYVEAFIYYEFLDGS